VEQLRLLEVRVQLHLVDGGFDAGVAQNKLELGMVMFEVPMWRTRPKSTNCSILRQVRM